jgi:hypothetical protein
MTQMKELLGSVDMQIRYQLLHFPIDIPVMCLPSIPGGYPSHNVFSMQEDTRLLVQSYRDMHVGYDEMTDTEMKLLDNCILAADYVWIMALCDTEKLMQMMTAVTKNPK